MAGAVPRTMLGVSTLRSARAAVAALLTTCLAASVTELEAQTPAPAAPGFAVLGTARPDFEVAAEKVVDLNGDGREEFVLLGRRGEVRTLQAESGEFRGGLVLPHPTRSIVAFAALDGGKKKSLVVFSPDGMQAFALRGGAFAGPPRRLLRRGRFTLRVGQPQFSEIVQDVNGDGRPDLVVPDRTACSLYLNKAREHAGNGTPVAVPEFVRTSRLELRVSTSSSTSMDSLDRQLQHRVTIPNLDTMDVNGDGKSDLVAEVGQQRRFHMQRADGAFPEQPDVVLDLSRFRDTTPKAGFEFGRTLAQDSALFLDRDLDGDKILDYVIAHRRKVWVYHGTKHGPQFEKPSKILILAEDVTFLVLMHLDDDPFPDLVVFKLKVPTLATLAFGFFASWDIEIRSVGYANEGGKTFARRPKWKGETVLRAPSISSLINNPEAIVARFKDVGRKFRHAMTGDVDGDGNTDVLLQTEDRSAMEYWLMDTDAATGGAAADEQMRKLLFEDDNPVWDVDRILTFLQSLADDRTARMTAGKRSSGSMHLRDPDKFRLEFAAPVDFDGDGRREIVLHYLDLSAPYRSTIDILRLRR